MASNPALFNPARVSALTLRYVVRFASLAYDMYRDRDRNHLVARFIWLKVLCAYPSIDLSIVLHAAVMLNVYLVSDYIVKGVIYIRLTD